MPINAHPEYLSAEKEYLSAITLEQKIEKLKKMISLCPGHKGAENLRAQLKVRLKKLQEQLLKSKKSGKSQKKSIRKEDMQAVIIGKTNSGKSSLLKALTNVQPIISEKRFTTQEPLVGMMNYEHTQIQIIEIPAIEGENFDKNLLYTADTILVLITSLRDLEEIQEQTKDAKGKKIIVFNKSDYLTNEEKRKISANLQSKKYNFILMTSYPNPSENLHELKKKIFDSFEIIRIFTKEPGKEKSNKPIIMKPHSTAKNVADKIFEGLSKKVKEIKIWGPSSKFGGQKVGLSHILKDKDVIELRTK
jgi:ribosome-interacting GTPase 1